jgi:predicted MFS family arabinose efflux permease
VAGQVMIPFAADLAPEERRGRVVARIMTGLLTGILLARTVSGLVAQVAGWRAIYWFSAALMVCFALILWRALPAEGARPHKSYGELVGGSLRLLVTEPVLRRRAFHGACAFAAFSVLWTTLAFLLSASPYNYSNLVIGLFGLVGAGGIAAANLAGKLADSETRTGTPRPPSEPASSWPPRSGSCGWGARPWPPSSSASWYSTSAPRACRSRTRP